MKEKVYMNKKTGSLYVLYSLQIREELFFYWQTKEWSLTYSNLLKVYELEYLGEL